MRAAVYLASMAVAAIAAPAIAANPEDASINAYYDGLAQARATDFATLADSFHPKGLFIFLSPQGPGPVVSGDQIPARAQGIAQRMKADGMTMGTGYRVEKRSVIGDVAVDSGYMRSTQTMKGNSRSNYARFLVTLKREGDKWRVISDAAWPSDEHAYNGVVKADGLKFDN